MAEQTQDRDRDSLSEEISQFRLQEYRRQGKVLQSREVTSVMVLIVTLAVLWAMGPTLGRDATSLLREMLDVSRFAHGDFATLAASHGVLGRCLMGLLSMAGPLVAAGFIVGVLASFLQVGAIFSTDPLTPDFAKINPLSGLQKFFSRRHVLDSARVVFKVIILIAISWFWIKGSMDQARGLTLSNVHGLLGFFGEHSRGLVTALVFALVIFAGADFLLQRSEYRVGLRLTKQEAKQEHKEHEGDPLLKARVRSIQRDMARRRMMESVKKADVVVTNPTHLAIAIQYDRGRMDAPRVVAKGADLLAQKIKQIAADAGVPLVENVPLARTLFKNVKVGKKIPKNLFKAVAEVLAYVYRLKGQGSWTNR